MLWTRRCASANHSPPLWMMLRIAPSGRKLRCFFSSSKMICARVTVVRSSLVLLSTILTSSPLRIISLIWSSVTYRLCSVSYSLRFAYRLMIRVSGIAHLPTA